ncbi:hypothetical protein PSEUBRA_000034 [Kalmanozyma brasiliensis GHG001]|uniref:uncharacterized protein n=1 Tax=Kalmanozyma brasiliensis (strain GHG001) TaxID=1365824 RepID=UPI002867ECF4|nr:uncharacterized protein PSEUBRA_000034 [Kalmanozyma brasiliensis GHG001]KAF6766766.1 hypothetical protein PSEUBRA_000034 [Kalmanozyma brasiliensis GHG001]
MTPPTVFFGKRETALILRALATHLARDDASSLELLVYVQWLLLESKGPGYSLALSGSPHFVKMCDVAIFRDPGPRLGRTCYAIIHVEEGTSMQPGGRTVLCPAATTDEEVTFDMVPGLIKLLIRRGALRTVTENGEHLPVGSVDEFLESDHTRFVGVGDGPLFTRQPSEVTARLRALIESAGLNAPGEFAFRLGGEEEAEQSPIAALCESKRDEAERIMRRVIASNSGGSGNANDAPLDPLQRDRVALMLAYADRLSRSGA